MAAGHFSGKFVGFHQEGKNGRGKIVASADHALHVMLLILHLPRKHRIGQIDHARHAPERGPKQEAALAFGGAIDHVIGRTQVFARISSDVMPIKCSLQMRGEKSVLDIHSGRQAQFCHTAEDQRLIGGLLRVLAKQNDPAGIQRAITTSSCPQ